MRPFHQRLWLSNFFVVAKSLLGNIVSCVLKIKNALIPSLIFVRYRVVSLGFEPKQTGPESVVLPLHHETILSIQETILPDCDAKVGMLFELCNT